MLKLKSFLGDLLKVLRICDRDLTLPVGTGAAACRFESSKWIRMFHTLSCTFTWNTSVGLCFVFPHRTLQLPVCLIWSWYFARSFTHIDSAHSLTHTVTSFFPHSHSDFVLPSLTQWLRSSLTHTVTQLTHSHNHLALPSRSDSGHSVTHSYSDFALPSHSDLAHSLTHTVTQRFPHSHSDSAHSLVHTVTMLFPHAVPQLTHLHTDVALLSLTQWLSWLTHSLPQWLSSLIHSHSDVALPSHSDWADSLTHTIT